MATASYRMSGAGGVGGVPDTFPGRAEALDWFDTERANLISTVALALDTGHYHLTTSLAAALGEYLHWRRHLTDWITASEHALTAAQHLHTSQTIAAAWNNLGHVLRQVRRFEEAITAHQQDLAICREAGDRHGEGTASTNLGLALGEVRRFEEAIVAQEQAAAIHREAGDRHREGTALNNLGNAFEDAGRLEKATDAWATAVSAFEEAGDPGLRSNRDRKARHLAVELGAFTAPVDG